MSVILYHTKDPGEFRVRRVECLIRAITAACTVRWLEILVLLKLSQRITLGHGSVAQVETDADAEVVFILLWFALILPTTKGWHRSGVAVYFFLRFFTEIFYQMSQGFRA
jgi:hypothetical protein